MTKVISDRTHTGVETLQANDSPPNYEEIDPIPLDAIIPLIKEEWNDEDYAYGELYDSMYSKLSKRSAQLRQQLQRCKDAQLHQRLEQELADVEDEIGKILLKFEEATPYPD